MGPSTEPGGLSARGRRDLATLFGAGQRTVTVDAAAAALGFSRESAARRLSAWASRGWLRRVRRGLYIAVPVDARDPATWNEDPWYLADLVWDPCYIAGWSAANHWALTDQVFRSTVVATAQRVRRVDQDLAGASYLVHHVGTDLLEWGLVGEWRGDRKISVSGRERTVADMLSDRHWAGASATRWKFSTRCSRLPSSTIWYVPLNGWTMVRRSRGSDTSWRCWAMTPRRSIGP